MIQFIHWDGKGSIEIDDNGMLYSILVEVEGTFQRWLYKRNPA